MLSFCVQVHDRCCGVVADETMEADVTHQAYDTCYQDSSHGATCTEPGTLAVRVAVALAIAGGLCVLVRGRRSQEGRIPTLRRWPR